MSTQQMVATPFGRVDQPAVDWVKALAIVLITNSHLDLLYPDVRMSAGGLLGNVLFFIASGYGLALGLDRPTAFWPWLRRRLMRVYVPVILVGALGLLLFPVAYSRPNLDAFGYFIWPTPYWFVSAIVLFYPVYFWFWRCTDPRGRAMVLAALLLAYVFFYATQFDLAHKSIDSGGYFGWIFYLVVMLASGWLARNRAFTLRRAGYWAAACFVSWASFKLLVGRFHLQSWQFVLHLASAGFGFAVFCLFRQAVDAPGLRRLMPLVLFLSSISFEVYLVQRFLSENSVLQQIGWPWGVLAFWPLCFAMAWCAWWLGQRISTILAGVGRHLQGAQP
jgi:peptidoglycan/LPS O-acetylase OafA/YrhL